MCRAARSEAGAGASGPQAGQRALGVNRVVDVLRVPAFPAPLVQVEDPQLQPRDVAGVEGVPDGLAGHLLSGDGAVAVGVEFVGLSRERGLHRALERGLGFGSVFAHGLDDVVELLDVVVVALAVGRRGADEAQVDAVARRDAERGVVGGLVLEPALENETRGGVMIVRGLAVVRPRQVGALDDLVAEASGRRDARAARVRRAAVLRRDAQAGVVDVERELDAGLHGVAGLVG